MRGISTGMQTTIRETPLCSNTLCGKLRYWNQCEYPSDLRRWRSLPGGGTFGPELVVQVRRSMRAVQTGIE